MNRLKIRGLYVEITDNCNLKCKHCYNESGGSNKEINLQDLFKTLDNAYNAGLRGLSISGGEPFASKQLIEILKYIQKYPELKVSIVTNATLINQDNIKEITAICKYKPAIQISLEGIGNANDYIRGVGVFERIERSIELLNGNGFQFYFHTLLHKMNINQIEDLILYAIEKNALSIDFVFLKKKGRGCINFDEISFNVADQISAISELNMLSKKYGDSIVINHQKVFYGRCPLFLAAEEASIFPRIDVFGNVYVCQNFCGLCSTVGNIATNSIVELLDEKHIQDLSKRIKNSKILSKCNTCYLSSFCGRGCPGIEYSDFNESNVISDECELRREYARTILNKI